jgi:hypothetical protein
MSKNMHGKILKGNVSHLLLSQGKIIVNFIHLSLIPQFASTKISTHFIIKNNIALLFNIG